MDFDIVGRFMALSIRNFRYYKIKLHTESFQNLKKKVFLEGYSPWY